MVNANALVDGYRRQFGGAPPSFAVRAPGRVNLIGEHVDYNDGLVLPIAIERATYAAAGPAERDCVRACSASLGDSVEFDLADIRRPAMGSWEAYVKGVAAELLKAGVSLRGTNLYIDSDLPIGAGLSSSAALEVAAALGLLAVAEQTLPMPEVSRLCRSAERDYAGVPCGIMDQMACTMAQADAAMLLDCPDQQVRHIAWPDPDVIVLVIDSQARHKLTEGTYAERVRQCAAAVDHIRRLMPGVRALRDVSMEHFAARQAGIDGTVLRRARHVISEIARTQEAAEALERSDFVRLGRLMNESHFSLRDDYEVSSPQLDDLTAAVREVSGVFGARLTGAGFGGCIVAIARREALAAVESIVRAGYDRQYGVRAELMPTRPCRGASVSAWSDPT